MNCAKVHRLLSAYHDAELATERRRDVRRHLRECESCKAALDRVKELTILGGKLADMQAPASVWDALAPQFQALCDAATPVNPEETVASENRPRPNPRRTFKPLVEGLEDRHAMADLVGMAVSVMAPLPEVCMATLRHADEAWATIGAMEFAPSASVGAF